MWNDRNETKRERSRHGLEKQLSTINKKNWFDGKGRRLTPTYYTTKTYIYLAATLPRYRKPYNIYAFDGERINISRTASPLTPRPRNGPHFAATDRILPIFRYIPTGIKAEESNAKYYPFPPPYPIKWKSSIWIFMNIDVAQLYTV